MEPGRWTAALRIEWRPVLAYARRRAALIDWFDTAIDITGFSEDNNEFLGIEIGDTQRVAIQRDSLGIMLGDPKDDAARVAPAITGVLEILQPTDPSLTRYLATWSVQVEGEYDERRQALARRASALPDATDCAIVVDVPYETGLSQVEYGIVTDRELKTRLAHPEMNRLTRSVGYAPPPLQAPDPLPAVSLFGETYVLSHRPGILGSSDAVLEALNEAENHSRGLISALQRGLG
jgi:hypothetical protein